jgi:methylated-DNA-[protein]-cysteine S-methyltransferase
MPTTIETLYMPDVLDGLTLVASPRGLRGIHFGQSDTADHAGPLVRKAERQLREFFAGERFAFDVELDLVGTTFQLEVWRALPKIPYAGTRSYRDIAVAVDRPKGYQAIGQANTRNPIPIIVPCHRVINADGSMGGYGGGLDRKQQLLELEQNYAHRFRETAA